ncbi:MAG: hypothetical protein R6T98_01230, partial [Desulfatiglandales bacterium]
MVSIQIPCHPGTTTIEFSGEYNNTYTDGTAEYTITGETKDTRTLDSQDEHAGWTRISTKIKPGSSQLEIELRNASGKIAADAVKVVYAGKDAGDMVFAHYYVKGDNDQIYLVNMDGVFTYYRFDDDNENDRVDPGELTRLDPVLDGEEISAAGIQTGRRYLEERQNFANWYQFYRKRSFTGIGAVSQFIEDLSGAYFRMTGFPPAGFKFPMAPIEVTVDGNYYDETETVLENLYNLKSPQAAGTGTMGASLKNTGEFFDDEKSTQPEIQEFADSTNSPFFKEIYGGECQQAFAILMTGGYWSVQNASRLGMGDVDEDG